jgi:hypothetical protein
MWRGSSPSLAAMSAMERRMIVVERGSSMPRAAMPKAPPIAPEVATAILCMRLLASRAPAATGLLPRLFTATSNAFSSAFSVALCTAPCRRLGSIFMPFSTGAPM